MNKQPLKFIILCLLCWYSLASVAQTRQIDSLNRLVLNQNIWFEVDMMMNPIYISQFGSKFYLDGQRRDFSPTPKFYSVLPGQLPFSNLSEILDQSNAVYMNFRMKFLDKSKFKLLHDMRLIFGVTHDKLQAASGPVYYKYRDGGTEATLMLDRRVAGRLSDLNFASVGLIFNVDLQGGFFVPLAKVTTRIYNPGDTILSTDSSRWIWQEHSPFLSGWGWIFGANVEIGGVLCHSFFITPGFTATGVGKFFFEVFKHVAVTVGAKLSAEGLHSNDRVDVNGVPGSRLRASNYGIFFSGPLLNIKLINLWK